jgi:hypothetical protein
MIVSIPGYDIELNYFPGTAGDSLTAPTEPDCEIRWMRDHEGRLLSDVQEDALAEFYHDEIWQAIRKKLADEEAQDKFDARVWE